MLDIVQSFPLLSYCIVSPIYISPICNVEIHYSEKIKLGILYFSLFTETFALVAKLNTVQIIVSTRCEKCIFKWRSYGGSIYGCPTRF